MLAITGFFHELHHYLLVLANSASSRSTKTPAFNQRRLGLLHLNIHGLIVAAVVVFVVGGVDAATATTLAKLDSAMKLRKAGAIILVLVWASLLAYGLYLLIQTRGRLVLVGYVALASGTLLATVAVGVRVLYTVIVVFDNDYVTLKPKFPEQVGCIFLVSLIAVTALAAAGWCSISIVGVATLHPGNPQNGELTPEVTHEVVAGKHAEA
jgi:hypothetical protein